MSIQNEELAEVVRNWMLAWSSKDIKAIVTGSASAKGGFGWRTFDWRDQPAKEETLQRFFDNMEYYTGEEPDIHTWSEGNIGLAWGTFTESFKQKGQTPEKARVRFTSTFKKDDKGWHELMSHRDIQSFGEDGRYPVELTRIS